MRTSPNISATSLALSLGVFALLGATLFGQSQSRAASAEPAAPGTGKTPRIVATTPQIGAKDVDPSITQITVTFDRDMAPGFSWTGGGPGFPPNPGKQKPAWRDQRTCTLPVKLEAGKYYRVGINSKSHRNFRSAEGIPAAPAVIYFTTQGASPEVVGLGTTPKIVEMVPKNGATDVDPAIRELRVTFSTPMHGGFSWTGGGPEFPEIPAGQRPSWTADKKTCLLPVKLKPGSSYRLGLNSPSHKNFQSTNGIPLEPVVYTFKTR